MGHKSYSRHYLQYEGNILVRKEKSMTLEGQEKHRRNVIIEFPTSEKANEFYNSHEYPQVQELPINAAIGEIFVIGEIQSPGELR